MNLHAVFLWAMMLAATAASLTIRPDCEGDCGNVSIPYPFGTREGCFLNEDFFINCSRNSTHSQPFLRKGNYVVQEIMLENHELRVLSSVARRCYNKTGYLVKNTLVSGNLKLFPFSNKRNKFTAVGCDTEALFRGENVTTGCLSVCNSTDSVTSGSCTGIGCCQTSIPKGLLKYNVTVHTYHNHTFTWSFNPCSYTFLVEEGSFNFSTADLIDLQKIDKVSTVLDWAVGNQTCEEAQKNSTSYACKENSNCTKSDNGPGYRCYCSVGYRGNPYLPNGCYDVDECEDPELNDCTDRCTNTIGGYNCSCPWGHHGHGRGKDGCTADQLLFIKITIGVGVGLIVLLTSSSWLYWILKKRKFLKVKEKYFRQNGGLILEQQLSKREGSNERSKIFTAEELEKATNKYNESKIIGRGGFGIVYKGILSDGRVVAIKKSKMVDQSQVGQFINEVVVLSQINHRNIVKLLGCCLETEVPLLVYEFVTNGTLFDYIHKENKVSPISWETRIRIAAETAGVLSYLHSAASPPIIHRDIKSNNILLDDNYTAKVSDFGTSRLVPQDQMQLSTMVQGTLGFGVVLVELLTGMKALSFDKSEEERSLAMYFLSSLKENRLFQLLEDNISHEVNGEELNEVALLAKRCLELKGEDRPTMKEVAMELEGMRKMKMHPWIGELNSEETIHLLDESSNTHQYDTNGNVTTVYDSIRDHITLPLHDAR
ncbi:Wall-associated receptor kinase 2 [Vitis vinifera]|uniref:Wall-associated receptor kinase 2 n=1 Tax=Vitis vinifera TaxID=29760 RepID=A0A438ETL0_VITVI|nr:Wall-associated receptor kinase 2 [Vitis vinifera]